MSYLFRSLWGLLVLVFLSCDSGGGDTDAIAWGYSDADGPAIWAELSTDFATCAIGSVQSPVDINKTSPGELEAIEMSLATVDFSVEDTGQLLVVTPQGSSTVDWEGATYTLQRIIVRGPSEHVLRGEQQDLEFQMTFTGDGGGTLFVSTFAIRGSEARVSLEPLISAVPSVGGAATGSGLDLSAFFPQDPNYATYAGSLTTPPCTEGVDWVLFTTPIELTQSQVTPIWAVTFGRVRPLQALGNRQIFTTDLPVDTGN